jgi:hypothetical protein
MTLGKLIMFNLTYQLQLEYDWRVRLWLVWHSSWEEFRVEKSLCRYHFIDFNTLYHSHDSVHHQMLCLKTWQWKQLLVLSKGACAWDIPSLLSNPVIFPPGRWLLCFWQWVGIVLKWITTASAVLMGTVFTELYNTSRWCIDTHAWRHLAQSNCKTSRGLRKPR